MNDKKSDQQKKSSGRWKVVVGLLLIFAIVGGYIGWDRGFREFPQADWVTRDAETRFMYGSIGAEWDAGVPYWIFYVLPRMFPEKFPGPGGYASLGVPWEEGQELPIGFTKKRIGFERVANNCAVCHTATYRETPDSKRVFVPLGSGHTTNVQGYFRLLIEAAKDPRFNADNIMVQIQLATQLDLIDTLLYRYLIIPITRKTLLEREDLFQWMYNSDYPHWGPGRDDAMNLTKYFMIGVEPPDDGTYGPTDFPSIWNLGKYKTEEGIDKPQRMNLAGDTWDAYSVVMDSALGVLGAEPHDNEDFVDQVQWLTEYAKQTPAPQYPFAVDVARATQGKAVFGGHCASCHGSNSDKVGRPIPLAEVGTSPDRMKTWNGEYAVKANQIVSDMGLERRGLVEQDPIGYRVPYLDGIWLRAPYLHNGSVPNLSALLTPPSARPKQFYRGYDVYDRKNVGFIAEGPDAQRYGMLHDATRKGNGNQGHAFGTQLAPAEKSALVEYLKTL